MWSFTEMSGLNKVRVLWTKQSPSILENRSRQKYLPSSLFQISICCQGQMEIGGWCLCPVRAGLHHLRAALLSQLCSAGASLEETPPSAELAWPKSKPWLVLHVAFLLEDVWECGYAICKSQACNLQLSQILPCICGAQALANGNYTGEFNWNLHTWISVKNAGFWGWISCCLFACFFKWGWY